MRSSIELRFAASSIPFVARPAQGYPLAEAALHDGAAGRVDGLDPPHRAPRDGHAGDPGQHEDQHDAQGQRHVDLLREHRRDRRCLLPTSR